MTTLQDLIAQKAALEKQIEDTMRRERDDAVAKIKQLMADYGLTISDLQPKPQPRRAKASAGGSKVAAKYRNTATGETWSGRGLQPRWLKAALAEGRSLEDFRV